MTGPRLVKITKPKLDAPQMKEQVREDFPPATISKRVAERLAKWKSLREMPQDKLDLRIQVKVLNGAIKAINREQNTATIWIAMEADSKPGQRTEYLQKGISACIAAEELLWRFGYTKTFEVESCEIDKCGKVIQARDGRVIISLSLEVKDLQEQSMDTVTSLKKKWAQLNAGLPKEEKRPAYKKKKK